MPSPARPFRLDVDQHEVGDDRTRALERLGGRRPDHLVTELGTASEGRSGSNPVDYKDAFVGIVGARGGKRCQGEGWGCAGDLRTNQAACEGARDCNWEGAFRGRVRPLRGLFRPGPARRRPRTTAKSGEPPVGRREELADQASPASPEPGNRPRRGPASDGRSAPIETDIDFGPVPFEDQILPFREAITRCKPVRAGRGAWSQEGPGRTRYPGPAILRWKVDSLIRAWTRNAAIPTEPAWRSRCGRSPPRTGDAARRKVHAVEDRGRRTARAQRSMLPFVGG